MLLEALPLLSQVVNDPLSKLPENIDATENAISAVTKICKYNHGNIAVDDVIPIWLSWLPIIEDKEEAPHVYGYLCDLIQRYQFVRLLTSGLVDYQKKVFNDALMLFVFFVLSCFLDGINDFLFIYKIYQPCVTL